MINKEQAIKNLVDVQEVFPLGFLAYGSALGAHRDGDVIDHDLDTDFGVFSSGFRFDGINELVRRGFEIIHIFGMRYHGMEIALKRGGVKTDVMIIYKDGVDGKYWNCLWNNGGENGLSDEIRHEYMQDVFETPEFIKIGDHTFNYFGEKYIKAVYGEDWKTPKTPWDWRIDHKCNINNHE